tara:strand:+ start:17966 stop:18172 length:207 start_codon:yes stop_codon:yes gene_type:complete
MIIKWIEWSFICDICHNSAVHPDNEHRKNEAIKDLRNGRYVSFGDSLKGWDIKGDEVICLECKKEKKK